jgi:hypothetical protein
MAGYLRAQRDRFKHHLFRSEQFCRGYAWDWMCSKACYAPRPYTVKGKTLMVQRGQFVASPDEMAEAWNWSRSAVNRFLARLKTEHMIEHETGHGKSLITICNYEEYQADTPQAGQESGQESGHKADTKRTAKEKGKGIIRNEEEDGASGDPPKPSKAPSVKVKRATRLPDDWVLPKSYGEFAVSEGMAPDEARRVGLDFRDYWLGKGASNVDWMAVWRRWIRKNLAEAKTRPATASRVSGFISPEDAAVQKRLDRVLADAAARRSIEGRRDNDSDHDQDRPGYD